MIDRNKFDRWVAERMTEIEVRASYPGGYARAIEKAVKEAIEVAFDCVREEFTLPTAAETVEALGEGVRASVLKLAESGTEGKVQAIMVLRDDLNIGLADAKRIVDEIIRTG